MCVEGVAAVVALYFFMLAICFDEWPYGIYLFDDYLLDDKPNGLSLSTTFFSSSMIS